MKSTWRAFISMVAVVVSGASTSQAAIRIVSNSSELQSALNAAVAGDEIILTDGIYTGQFNINGNSGTTSAPITVRAANRHKAILRGTNTCSGVTPIFNVSRSYWVIKDLVLENTQRGIYIDGVASVNVNNNILRNFHADGIAIYGSARNHIHSNVIALGDACNSSYEDAGIALYNNSDNNTIQNNIVFATGDNGYTYGDKNGYGMIIANNSDDNLVQGNLFFANGGKGIFRILGAPPSANTVDRNKIYDNAFLWGEGENSSHDCVDDSNQYINNIMYGNYQAVWGTKGNYDGTKGHHLLKHNLFYTDAFARVGAILGTGGEPFCPNLAGISYKIQNTVDDNIFYSPDRQSDFHRTWLVWGYPAAIKQAGHNLFWAPGANSADWVMGYTYQSTDVRDPNKKPIFTNAANGDFSLVAGSPGKGAASDGKDIGIEYNVYLKKAWLQNAFSLPTQQKDNLATSASFTVNSSRYYQVWFYIPESACKCTESFNVEGQNLTRDINGLTTGNLWIQPGGPARWVTLGRHRATDGTLNISWSNSASASKIFIRELPTPDEAYGWITGASVTQTQPPSPLPQPTPSSALTIPGRIEAEDFIVGGGGVAYHDTTSENLDGAYRASEAVDIKLAAGGAGYTIGYTDAGEWLKYNLNVAHSGNYAITLRAANGAGTNGALHLEIDGVNVTGTVFIPPTGSYDTETTVTGPTIALNQGPHTLRVYMEVGNFDLNWLEFTSISVAPPVAPSDVVAVTP